MMANSDEGPRVDRWYVAFRNRELPGGVYVRNTRTFPTECEAKRFASERLAEGCDVSAGTHNPYRPKKTIGLSGGGWIPSMSLRGRGSKRNG